MKKNLQPRRKKLLLILPIEPDQPGLANSRSFRFPPLGLAIIASLTPSNFDVKILDENFEKFKYEEADVVGITAFTASAARAYEISSVYREKGIPVIMGGIHASMNPEEALRYADSVVIGEAEDVWRKLLSDLFEGRLKKIYRGSKGEFNQKLLPRRDLLSPKYHLASVQTSRGCPMDCNFCSVTPFNGRKYRQRPVDEILDELEQIPQKTIFFVDDNLIGHGKEAEERAIRLFKGMVDRKLKKNWVCQASINFGSRSDVLHWAQKAGCKLVLIGLESTDPHELKKMNKWMNLQTEYEKAFRAIHRHGIAILGTFIFGSDNDTREGLERKTKYILRSPVDLAQVTVMTPFPGSRLYAQYEKENRLTSTFYPSDWARYNVLELNHRLLGLDRDEFHQIYKRSLKKIYSRWTIIRKFIMTLLRTRNPVTAAWAIYSYRNYRHVWVKMLKNRSGILTTSGT